MRKKNPKVDAYLAKLNRWRKESEALRGIALACGLSEELKWGKPCYDFEGGNVAIIQGFKEYCALLFCKGALLKDPRKLLIQQTKNVQAARQLRFTNVRQIVDQKSVIKRLLHNAIAVEKAGLEVTFKETREYAVPAELTGKLQQNPALNSAFQALTPGRQRGYLLYFSAPKQSKTRESRIDQCTPRILNGKGLRD